METTTARNGGPRPRRTRLFALAGALAAVATIPFAGSAAAAVGSGVQPASAASGGLVPGTPCHYGAAACIQLGNAGYNGKSWFIRDRRVVRGPVPSLSGGPGKETSTGTFPVTLKDIDHVSSETTNAQGQPSPMPYAVFWGNQGEAFHGGGDATLRTAGCVRLANPDASYFFNNLNMGDQVEIVSSSAPVAGGGYDNNGNGYRNNNRGGLLGGL